MWDKDYINLFKATLQKIAKEYSYSEFQGPDFQNNTEVEVILHKYCFENQWRYKKLNLKPGFSHLYNGPLLGFYGNEKIPCIIELNGKDSFFYRVDNNIKQVLNLDNEVEFKCTAYSFYECFPNKSLTKSDFFTFIFKGFNSYWPWILGVTLLSSLLYLILPISTKYLTQKIIITANTLELWQILFISVALLMSKVILEACTTLCVSLFGNKLTERALAAVFDRILKLPIGFYQQSQAGNLSEAILAPIEFQETFITCFVSIIQSLFINFFVFVTLLILSWNLTLSMMPLFIVYFAFTALLLNSLMKKNKGLNHYAGEVAGDCYQLFNGIDKIISNNAETMFFEKNLIKTKGLFDFYFNYNMHKSFIAAIGEAFPWVVNVLFMIYVIKLSEKSLSVSSSLVYLVTLSGFLTISQALFQSVRNLILGIGKLERMTKIFESEIEDESGKKIAPKLDGSIELQHISYSIDSSNNYLFKDISLTINPGEFVAIVGPSGSGKSTLLKLMLGLYSPTSGEIIYSNERLKDLNKNSLCKQIGIVMQNGHVLPTTLRENISCGEYYSLNEIKEAVNNASLDELVEELPYGLDSEISSSVISGGQEQRIMIARALIKKPKILMMDEATSALDNITQKAISDNIDEMNTTRIVIAHRLSTIINADKIYVLKDGKIEESGSYNDLMEKKGFFYKLVERQKV